MAEPRMFGEADLENEALGESSGRCSYAPAASEVSALRSSQPDDEPLREDRVTLRAPAPSAALLELSGLTPVLAERDEPLRETREPFRLALRDTLPECTRTTAPPANLEEALTRAARSSFASAPPAATDRQSGVRISAPHTIEEAVLRAVDATEPLTDLRQGELPKA